MTNNPFDRPNPVHAFESFDELRQMTEKPGRFYFTVMASRPWVKLFVTKLEHEQYPPRTEKNTLFEFMMVKWPDDDPILWFVCGIPAEDRPVAERYAQELGLRFADGVPSIIQSGSQIFFPVDPQNPNIWNLENDTRRSTQDGQHRRSGFTTTVSREFLLQNASNPFMATDSEQRAEEQRLIEEIINRDQDERFLGKFKQPEQWVRGFGDDSK
jgi:hypothetical protein